MLFATVNLMWVVWGLAAVVAFFLVKELFRKDEQIEDRRRHAIAIADELTKEGLSHIPAMLHDYAVGDYSGMIDRVKSWYEFLRDDEQRRAFFLKFLKTQLERSMNIPERRAAILEAVEQWQAIEDTKLAKVKEQVKTELAADTSAKTDYLGAKTQ